MTKSIATLIVYAYSSFTSSWGPGPELAKKFEENCKCEVRLVDGGDGGALISRLKLEGKDSQADVVIGIDETLIPRVKKDLGWPTQTKFEAYDFGPYAFIYNSEIVKDPPQSLDDLLLPKWKGQILLEDPRLSTAGLGFLLWVVKEKGEGAWDYLKKLKPQIKVVSPSWDLAYGMFKKNQGQLVFSYWSSPAYHIQEENKKQYKGAEFKKGHYMQTEYLVAIPGDKKKDLKTAFIKFMLSPPAQELMPKKNFMYPAIKNTVLTPAFEQLGMPKLLSPLSEKDLQNLETWLTKWRDIFS